uniref:DUF1758 domain-containing protein n=1 Tax=Loa loa TaxID=7209 RepID=A0A1I7VRF8_LOALO
MTSSIIASIEPAKNRGEALQAVSGYEIAPENYGIIRQLLKNKYADPSTIASILYRELQSFKQNEKEWMTTIENIGRVLRQLEALGDNLEHPNIESIIESKMPSWILNKDLVEVNQQVKIDQYSNFRADSKPTTIKGEQKRMYRPEITSTLSTIQTNHRETRSQTIRKRPCIFCSCGHWDSDCDIYSTVKGRMKRLKTLRKCTICLKDSHQGETKPKKRCFYCKAPHNSALCEKRSTPTLNITTLPKKQESIYPNKKEGPVSYCQCVIEYTHSGQWNYHNQHSCSRIFNTGNSRYTVKEQCEDLTSHWDKPDILIGADCFFKFVDSQDKKELHSGYIMIHSKVGPMVTGEGYIDELCNSKGHFIPIICSVYTNPNSELEKFWRLEMIDIHESPTDDDERAIDHFNKTIIKLDGRYQRKHFYKSDYKKKLYAISLDKGHQSGSQQREYEMLSLQESSFWRISSPFLLTATLNYHLGNSGSTLAKEIRQNLYVDNVTISVNNTEEAFWKYEEMEVIFQEASMNIREFLSNDQGFNEKISYRDLSKPGKNSFLGISWNHERDRIGLTLKPWIGKFFTKRTILQFIASQYDPLGYLVPVMVRLKLFIQHLWRQNVSWDQSLSESDSQYWRNLINEWPTNVIELPRHVINPLQSPEFHVFTDASQVAYSAAVYIRNCMPEGWSTSSLIFAKSRIAPIKGLSIPRLELLSVLIGVGAGQFVLRQLHEQIKNPSVTLWSNSKFVLYWIMNYTKLLPRFVQTRVEETRSSKFKLRHILSQENPVDVATRGLSPCELRNYEQWWNGPDWLDQDESQWPNDHFRYQGQDEFEKAIIANMTTSPSPRWVGVVIQFIEIHRFSKWTKLLRATVWALKFIKQICRRRLSWLQLLSTGQITMTTNNYKIAQRLLIRQVQSQSLAMDEKKKWSLFKKKPRQPMEILEPLRKL